MLFYKADGSILWCLLLVITHWNEISWLLAVGFSASAINAIEPNSPATVYVFQMQCNVNPASAVVDWLFGKMDKFSKPQKKMKKKRTTWILLQLQGK